MGLDVGTVRFDYSHSPTGIRRKFAWYLAENYDDAHWGLAEGENIIAEYTLDSLLSFAESYATSANLSDSDKAKIDAWIHQLPYRNGHIALHFSW